MTPFWIVPVLQDALFDGDDLCLRHGSALNLGGSLHLDKERGLQHRPAERLANDRRRLQSPLKGAGDNRVDRYIAQTFGERARVLDATRRQPHPGILMDAVRIALAFTMAHEIHLHQRTTRTVPSPPSTSINWPV